MLLKTSSYSNKVFSFAEKWGFFGGGMDFTGKMWGQFEEKKEEKK